jgi:large conductance mechanosensitive channel
MLKEFREFIMRGNVVDLAVAVIIGAAFGAIVVSLVNDILMPLLGVFTGGVNFSDLYINLSGRQFESYAAAKEAGAAVIGYGAFINAIITFVVIAFAVFVIVRLVNRFYKQQAPAAGPTRTEELLVEIRDLLASNRPGGV